MTNTYRTRLMVILICAVAAMSASGQTTTRGPSVVAAATSPATTEAYPPFELLAQGDKDVLYVATNVRDPLGIEPPEVRIRRSVIHPRDSTISSPLVPGRRPSRVAAAEGPFEDVEIFTRRIVNLGHWSGNLIVVFEDGQWGRLSSTGYTSGPSLPGDGRAILVNGAGEALWAIGQEGKFPPPATQPDAADSLLDEDWDNSTTRPASNLPESRPASLPATAPSSQPLSTPRLFQFTDGAWEPVADLPGSFIADAPRRISLAPLGANLILAGVSPAGNVRTWQFDPASRQWTDAGIIESHPAAVTCKLLNTPACARLWVAGDGDPGRLFIQTPDQNWLEVRSISLPRGSAWIDRTMAQADGELRFLLLQKPDASLLQQKYDLSGAPLQDLAPVNSLATPVGMVAAWWFQVVVIALVVIMLATLRRRNQQIPKSVFRLPLAPPPTRMVAGCIDAFPILLWLALSILHSSHGDLVSALLAGGWKSRLFWFYGAGYLVYVTHTLVSELLTGQTLGKWTMGLKVVGMDGAPPSRRAILIRNLLRLIDVSNLLLFLPLLMIVISPLRQRIGDALAGTVVIDTNPPSPAENHDEEE